MGWFKKKLQKMSDHGFPILENLGYLMGVEYKDELCVMYGGKRPEICPRCGIQLVEDYVGGTGADGASSGNCEIQHYFWYCPEHPREGWPVEIYHP